MLITGLIMLGVSILGGIFAVIAFGASMVASFTQFGESTYEINEHVTVDGLGDNQWYIYQDPQAMDAICTVLDEQGHDIVQRSSDMDISTNELSLTSFQSFQSTTGAVYEIECSEYPVTLGGPVPLGGVFGLVITVVIAILVFITGVVLTILGAVRRSRAKRPVGPPGGGYPYSPGGYPGYGYPQSPPHQSGGYPPNA